MPFRRRGSVPTDGGDGTDQDPYVTTDSGLDGDDIEPSAEDLAEIKAEEPLSDAEINLPDAKIRLLLADPAPTAPDCAPMRPRRGPRAYNNTTIDRSFAAMIIPNEAHAAMHDHLTASRQTSLMVNMPAHPGPARPASQRGRLPTHLRQGTRRAVTTPLRPPVIATVSIRMRGCVDQIRC